MSVNGFRFQNVIVHLSNGSHKSFTDLKQNGGYLLKSHTLDFILVTNRVMFLITLSYIVIYFVSVINNSCD